MKLKVIGGPDSGKELFLHPGNSYFIGRDPAYCQLALKDSEVSRKHLSIFIDSSGDVTATDNSSQNGTYLHNQKLVMPTKIKPGDSLSLGETTITIEVSAENSQHRYSQPSRNNSSEKRFNAHTEGTTITIGRDPDNSIVLNHPHVSRKHAVIKTTKDGTYIRDLNSTNGTYVDGTKVTGNHFLEEQSVIRINGFRLTMEDFEVVKYDETAGQVDIDIHDLSKVVTLPGGEERIILNNLNFRIQPREFVAILGGSGAGKSSLLKAMMGTWPANFGEILINGTNYYEQYGAFKSMIGYVPQDDIVHVDLTVEEVLTYAARLRMPNDITSQEINERVVEVMQTLGLIERRNTVVKNLSGGQRKRVSIGVELITMPSIMFLDEPTSGLDPGLEKIMMEMMRSMADQGQTIILVTHATFNIELCDKLVFLTEGGRMAFFGTPREALEYFGTNDFAEIYKMINIDKSPEHWQYKYANSKHALKYKPIASSERHSSTEMDYGKTRHSSLKQWYDLTCRYTRTVIRDKKSLIIMLLQPVILAALICLVFLSAVPVFEESTLTLDDVTLSSQAVLEGRLDEVNENITEENLRIDNMVTVVVAMVLSAVWSGAANSVREIVKEKIIYKRERFINLRIAPYLMSKVIILAAICLSQAVLFVSIIRLVIGMPYLGLSIAAFALIALSSALMGLTVSSLSSNANVATSTLPILLIPQFLMSGAIVPIETVEPEFLQYIFYVVVSKWGFELIGGKIIDINSLLAFDNPIKALDGPFETHWWILVVFIVGFYIITTLAMLKKDQDLS